MADWQRTLDLADLFKNARNEELTPQQTAKGIASKLETIGLFGHDFAHIDDARDELVMEFRDFSSCVDVDFDDLDEILRRLYDWGDQSLDGKFAGKKACWIKTF